ncbi:hypothetical protein EDB84DRAFT_1038954 [Lactarius hengduanensis]|nr:hypothetical protein EDB84DRAFT_1038954 [Lactarius hengduanensis]
MAAVAVQFLTQARGVTPLEGLSTAFAPDASPYLAHQFTMDQAGTFLGAQDPVRWVRKKKMTHLPHIQGWEEMLPEGASKATTVWSTFGNGGNGGDASSGSAFAHGPGAKAYTGPGGNASGGDVGRREPINSQISKKMPYPRLSPRGKYVPAHSSTGKFAASKNGGGGHHGGLINAWSGNGGDGGDASSGDAHAYSNRAPAYSGTGGHAAGGSVSGGRRDKVWKRDDGGARNKGAEAFTGHGGNASGGSVFGHGGLIDLIDIFSGNGGDGGDAISGSAYALGSDSKAFSGPGGDASGGSVNEGKHRRGHISILDFASGNGGGGDPGSGGAIAV